MRDFEKKGVSEIDEVRDAKGVVVIRSHGTPPRTEEKLRKNAEVIDATCPFVKRAQMAAKELGERYLQVIVVGASGHPEVEAIVAYGKLRGAQVYVVNSAEDLPHLAEEVGVVSQTTQSRSVFNQVVDAIKQKACYVDVKDTICSATTKRQDEALKLAKISDVMVVLGGKNSSNTRHLFEICSCYCAKTYHIETPGEVEILNFDCDKDNVLVGITAGASTPSNQIDELVRLINLKYSL